LNNKGSTTVAIIGILVIVLVIAAIAAGAIILQNNDDATNDVPINGVANATSIQFELEVTNGYTENSLCRYKNIGTENIKMRLEGTLDNEEVGVILNGELQKIWELADGEWVEVEVSNDTRSILFVEYTAGLALVTNELSEWTHGEHTFTAGNFHYRIYNITVNPVLDDSLFIP